MFVGIIRTRDILLNPRAIISMRGVKGFMKLVYRALRKKPYSFIGMTQESDWVFDKKIQEALHAEEALQKDPRHSKGKSKKHAPHKHHEDKKKR